MMCGMDTEDACQSWTMTGRCGAPARLLVHVALVTRNTSIETMLVPACDECYQGVVDSMSKRFFFDMIPRRFADQVVFWTQAAYAASWPSDTDDARDDDDDEVDLASERNASIDFDGVSWPVDLGEAGA